MNGFQKVVIPLIIVVVGGIGANIVEYGNASVNGAHSIVNEIPESQLAKYQIPTEVNGNKPMAIIGDIEGTISGK